MVATAGYLTPMLHVADIRRSIDFYRLLGLELVDYEGDPSCPGWARMHSEGGDVAFLLADEPLDPSRQSFFLTLYTDELPALREQLLANGLDVSEIRRPPYMPSGEVALVDPDGYQVFIEQWGATEHERWERERRERLTKLG